MLVGTADQLFDRCDIVILDSTNVPLDCHETEAFVANGQDCE